MRTRATSRRECSPEGTGANVLASCLGRHGAARQRVEPREPAGTPRTPPRSISAPTSVPSSSLAGACNQPVMLMLCKPCRARSLSAANVAVPFCMGALMAPVTCKVSRSHISQRILRCEHFEVNPA
jgi:hypothetical protein